MRCGLCVGARRFCLTLRDHNKNTLKQHCSQSQQSTSGGVRIKPIAFNEHQLIDTGQNGLLLFHCS
jgi:hypothetical protein